MNIGCESNAIIRTSIDRQPDIINIQLNVDIPNKEFGCELVMNIHEQYHAIDEAINLGMFGSGEYKLNINGYLTSFYIPEPEADLLTQKSK